MCSSPQSSASPPIASDHERVLAAETANTALLKRLESLKAENTMLRAELDTHRDVKPQILVESTRNEVSSDIGIRLSTIPHHSWKLQSDSGKDSQISLLSDKLLEKDLREQQLVSPKNIARK